MAHGGILNLFSRKTFPSQPWGRFLKRTDIFELLGKWPPETSIDSRFVKQKSILHCMHHAVLFLLHTTERMHCITLHCTILQYITVALLLSNRWENALCDSIFFFAVACTAILVDCSVLRLCICCPRNYIMHFKCIILQNALYHSISNTVASTYSHLGVRSERWKEGLPHCQKA